MQLECKELQQKSQHIHQLQQELEQLLCQMNIKQKPGLLKQEFIYTKQETGVVMLIAEDASKEFKIAHRVSLSDIFM